MSGALRSLVPGVIRRSYVLKVGITLLVLGLTIGTIGFVATDQIQETVRSGVEGDLADLAAQEANTFETWDRRNREVTGALAAGLRERGADFDPGGYLSSRADSFEGTAAVHVVDREAGTVTASTGELASGTALSAVDGDWAETLAGADLGREPRLLGTSGGAGGDPQLVYAAAVEGDRVLVYGVRASSYETAIQDEQSFVYVVDESYRVLYDSTGSATFEEYPRGEGRADALIKASEERDGVADYEPNVGATVTPGDGSLGLSADAVGAADAEYIPSYATVEGTGYTVLVHTPASQAMGFVATVEQWGFAAAIGGVLVIALFGLFVGYTTAASIDRLRLKSEEMERGNLDVDFETDRVDNVGQLYDSMANMRDALRSQILEARDAREEAEQARERAERTSRHLQAKANEYRDAMRAVAAGDLSQRMHPSERSEAMREIAEEFNTMIGEIERTVAQLKAFADEVARSSQTVTASAEEVRSASRQVTESIQQISQGADRQNDSLRSVAGEMEDLSTTVQEIAALSNEVADLSARTAQSGRRGREAAREAIAGMNEIERDSREAVEQIERLDEEMTQIDELVEVIADLADQTNMIALNANIEASRADGADDDSFGVVAREIKELAAETKEAAGDVEERIEHIQTTTDETVTSVTATGERIADNTASVRNAVEALDEIAEYAEETNDGVQQISAATQQQAASTEEVVGMVEEVADISDRTSGEAENVAAAAQQQTATVSQVTDSASTLSEQASRLSDALGRFRTREPDERLFGPADADDGSDGDRSETDADDPFEAADPKPADDAETAWRAPDVDPGAEANRRRRGEGEADEDD